MLRRYVRSVTLFTSDDLTWPTLVNSRVLQWRNDNTVVDTTSTALNATPQAPNAFLGPITLGEREVFVDIVVAGKYNANSANTLNDDFEIEAAASGELDCVGQDTLLQHPVKGVLANTVEDTFEATGYLQTGLHLFPAGQVAGAATGSYPRGSTVAAKWPFVGQNHVSGESWLWVWQISRTKGTAGTASGVWGGDPTVDGYSKIWLTMMGINPSDVTNGAVPKTSWRIYANIYEPETY